MLHDARVIGWRVYHADGTVTSSDHALDDRWAEEWAALPEDIICVLLFHSQKRHNGEHYRTILQGGSYYWWRAVNNLILWCRGEVTDDLFPADPEPGQVKEGRAIARTEFLDIINRAHGDRRWP